MKQIYSRGLTYNVHPIYDSFGSTLSGHIINLFEYVRLKMFRCKDRLLIVVKKQNSTIETLYDRNQFIWECFVGIVPKDAVVEFVDNNETNNELSKLQLVFTHNDGYRSSKLRLVFAEELSTDDGIL